MICLQKLLDPGTGFLNRILGIQARFLPSFGSFSLPLFRLRRARASTGARRLIEKQLLRHPTKLLVSQYNTSPLDADQKKMPIHQRHELHHFLLAGIAARRAWASSSAAGSWMPS